MEDFFIAYFFIFWRCRKLVSTIFAYGEDALNNEVSVTLQLPAILKLDDLDGMLTFRATGVQSPEVEIKTHTQSFRGYQIERWKPGREAKTTDVTFRIDKYWRVYDALYDWSNLIVDLEQGTMYADTLRKNTLDFSNLMTSAFGIGTAESLRGTLFINQENVSKDVLGKGWTYKGVFPKNIPAISFDATNEGTPVDVTVTFGYISFTRSV